MHGWIKSVFAKAFGHFFGGVDLYCDQMEMVHTLIDLIWSEFAFLEWVSSDPIVPWRGFTFSQLFPTTVFFSELWHMCSFILLIKITWATSHRESRVLSLAALKRHDLFSFHSVYVSIIRISVFFMPLLHSPFPDEVIPHEWSDSPGREKEVRQIPAMTDYCPHHLPCSYLQQYQASSLILMDQCVWGL